MLIFEDPTCGWIISVIYYVVSNDRMTHFVYSKKSIINLAKALIIMSNMKNAHVLF